MKRKIMQAKAENTKTEKQNRDGKTERHYGAFKTNNVVV
jgi:hypothetical protein